MYSYIVFLSYDIFGFCREMQLKSGMDEAAVMTLLLNESTVLLGETIGMTAERFIEIHNSNASWIEAHQCFDPSRHRSNMKAHTVQHFRRVLHK